MGIFAFIAAMIFAGFMGSVLRENTLEDHCNQIKVIDIKGVKYKCEVLSDQKLNWTPSKAR